MLKVFYPELILTIKLNFLLKIKITRLDFRHKYQ